MCVCKNLGLLSYKLSRMAVNRFRSPVRACCFLIQGPSIPRNPEGTEKQLTSNVLFVNPSNYTIINIMTT